MNASFQVIRKALFQLFSDITMKFIGIQPLE
jgi:hypothetical protein